jgi:hypothetical protein
VKWLALVLVLAVACGKSKAACKTDVADLMKFLRTMDHSMSVVQVDDEVHLAVRADLPAGDLVSAPVVDVSPGRLVYQGQLVADAIELAVQLKTSAERIQHDIDSGHTPHDFVWDHRVYLVIDADAPWGTVAAVAAAAASSGFDHAYVMFARGSPVAPPPRSSVSDELDRVLRDPNGGNKATELAHVVKDVVKSCPDIERAFGATASEAGADKAAVLIEGIGPALLACDCNLDMPAFRSAMWVLMGNPKPTTALALVLAKDGKPLEFPATAKWRDASKALAAGTVWLVAR